MDRSTRLPADATPHYLCRLGAIAQLGERLVCNQEVASSILAGSTLFEGGLNGGWMVV